MKIRKLMPVLLVVVALSTSATALKAQGYSLFGMGDVSSLFDGAHYTDPLGQFESAYKTGGGFTFGTEIPVSKILGVEAAYGLVRNNLAVTDYTLSPPAESAYGVRGQRISGDLVGHAPIFFLGFKPYLAAGVEYDRYSALAPGKTFAFFNGYSSVSPSPGNMVGFNYGGGLEKKLMYRVRLRFDVRDHVTASPTYGLPSSSSSSGPIFPISRAAHDLEYSAGLVFHLGK